MLLPSTPQQWRRARHWKLRKAIGAFPGLSKVNFASSLWFASWVETYDVRGLLLCLWITVSVIALTVKNTKTDCGVRVEVSVERLKDFFWFHFSPLFIFLFYYFPFSSLHLVRQPCFTCLHPAWLWRCNAKCRCATEKKLFWKKKIPLRSWATFHWKWYMIVGVNWKA